ncbi:MAG: diaminopimelate epimerase, partial [Candidatus Azotimanducaceae bacterium]
TQLIHQLCDRKFGIGADGLILLENSDTTDFKMVYFNADGNQSSMCGNGGRCIVAFAKYLNIIDTKTSFMAIDGIHQATIDGNRVNLQMSDIENIEVQDSYIFLNTGSPHHIEFVESVSEVDVKNLGREIRNGAPYFQEGTNVNFVEQVNHNTFKVRTFERGVEDETLSCGTGVTAVAIASNHIEKTNEETINIETLGGKLSVNFIKENTIFKNVFLNGPTQLVFQGTFIL